MQQIQAELKKIKIKQKIDKIFSTMKHRQTSIINNNLGK